MNLADLPLPQLRRLAADPRNAGVLPSLNREIAGRTSRRNPVERGCTGGSSDEVAAGGTPPFPGPATAGTGEMRASGRSGTIRLPWGVLVPDNARTGVLGGRALLSRRYRQAKQAAHLLAAEQWQGPPLEGPVQFVARVWFPDRRRRDAANLRKLVTDALEGVAYADDSQISDERWIRAGVDRQDPRCAATVSVIGSRLATGGGAA